MAPATKVTLREIARQTGVTRMAVSLALRGKPGVSAATRKAILQTAERLGYKPDPEVSKLLARIRTRTPTESTACLALLTSGASSGDWKRYATERKYVEGARARALEYGYRLEEFWVNEPGITPARLSSIMWNRGIEGVIVAPLQERLSDEKSRSVQLDFDLFSLVEISETIDAPDLDRSIHDQYTAMLKCLEELARLNYRTIGLVLQYELDLRVNGKWTAAYLRYRQQTGSKSMPPPLILQATRQADFDRWFDRHRPDAIISVDRFGLHFLKARGLRIPQQIGYATLDRDGDASAFPDVSGIDQNSHRVGAAAVDLLVATMHRGERGIPAHPVRMEVEGSWIAGSSTRRQRPARA